MKKQNSSINNRCKLISEVFQAHLKAKSSQKVFKLFWKSNFNIKELRANVCQFGSDQTFKFFVRVCQAASFYITVYITVCQCILWYSEYNVL